MKIRNARQSPYLRKVVGASIVAALALGSVGLSAPAASAATTDVQSSAGYALAVGGATTTLGEGQSATFPMVPVQQPGESNTVKPDAVYPGNGFGTLTVTASKGVFHYSIAMSVPATSFTGAFQITDRTSGLSGGRDLKFAFAGSTPTSKLKNHVYAGTLTGTAYLAGIPIANTMPNSTSYKYSDF